eukprot:SAG25_NODE_562_length_6909_cov_2.841557_12_plen_316_part_00
MERGGRNACTHTHTHTQTPHTHTHRERESERETKRIQQRASPSRHPNFENVGGGAGGLVIVISDLELPVAPRRLQVAEAEAPSRAHAPSDGDHAPAVRAMRPRARHHHATPFFVRWVVGAGAGGDHGIDRDKNWLRFPYDSTMLRYAPPSRDPCACPVMSSCAMAGLLRLLRLLIRAGCVHHPGARERRIRQGWTPRRRRHSNGQGVRPKVDRLCIPFYYQQRLCIQHPPPPPPPPPPPSQLARAAVAPRSSLAHGIEAPWLPTQLVIAAAWQARCLNHSHSSPSLPSPPSPPGRRPLGGGGSTPCSLHARRADR